MALVVFEDTLATILASCTMMIGATSSVLSSTRATDMDTHATAAGTHVLRPKSLARSETDPVLVCIEIWVAVVDTKVS